MEFLASASVTVVIIAGLLAYCYVEQLDHKERLAKLDKGIGNDEPSSSYPASAPQGDWSWTTVTRTFLTVHYADNGMELFVPVPSIVSIGNKDDHAILSLVNGSTVFLRESYEDVVEAVKKG